MKKKGKPTCKSCGEYITQDQGIMTNLEGAYHKDIPECRSYGLIMAPAPSTLANAR